MRTQDSQQLSKELHRLMRRRNVKDAEWIADLVRHGLVKANYITNR